MIDPEDFFNELLRHNIDFFAGVPDSLLKDFCAFIEDNAERNIITPNEGNAVGLAAGHYLATGKPAVVYMQNSGIGNAVNPLISLMDEDVYKIPVLLLIGWRGEPGKSDEPQHVKQGKITLSLLESMGIDYLILDGSENASKVLNKCMQIMRAGKPYALVVKKNTFSSYKLKKKKEDISTLNKETALELIVNLLGSKDKVIATTGKLSRELFFIRERLEQKHSGDFLTVGSMGHTSQIAMGLALGRPDLRVFCLDGDGSALMHMGTIPVNASLKQSNFRYIVFNNGSHDSVGGQPTVAASLSLSRIARECGYEDAISVDNEKDLEKGMNEMLFGELRFLEVKVAKGSRKDLGRPTISPQECKRQFMEDL